MTNGIRVKIAATGSYVPDQVFTSDLLARIHSAGKKKKVSGRGLNETLGIRERRITAPALPVARSEGALNLAREAMKAEGFTFPEKPDPETVYALMQRTLREIGIEPHWFDRVRGSPLVRKEVERTVQLDQLARVDGLDHLIMCGQLAFDAAACDPEHVPRQYGSDLAMRAGQDCLQRAGINYEDIDALVHVSSTHDYQCPLNGPVIDRKLSAIKEDLIRRNKFVTDVSSGCAGGMYALEVGKNFILSGRYKSVLIIASEHNFTVQNLDWRETPFMFGDGAAAIYLRPAKPDESGNFLSSTFATDFNIEALSFLTGGTVYPVSSIAVRLYLNWLRMNGKMIAPFVFEQFIELTRRVLNESGLKMEDIRQVAPHQMNGELLKAVTKKMDWPDGLVTITFEKYGNLTCASSFFALDQAIQSGRLKEGDVVFLIAMGIGLQAGAHLIEL